MQKLIVDRMEGNHVVCEKEDRSQILIPKSALPPNIKEGACLIIDQKNNYVIDMEATKERESRIRHKMKRLFE